MTEKEKPQRNIIDLFRFITRLMGRLRSTGMIHPKLYDIAGSYEGASRIRSRKSADVALYLRARRSFPNDRSWHRSQHFFWKTRPPEPENELDLDYSYAEGMRE